MAERIKATYDTEKTVKRVLFDLLGSGVPHNKIVHHKSKHQLDITIEKKRIDKILEIMERHNPEHIS